MKHESFWEMIDTYKEEKTLTLQLKSGKEFTVKIEDIANYDDNNAEITLEELENQTHWIVLDVSSIEYIEFVSKTGGK